MEIAELETVTQIKDKKRESDIYAREHEFALAIEWGIIRSVVGSPYTILRSKGQSAEKRKRAVAN